MTRAYGRRGAVPAAKACLVLAALVAATGCGLLSGGDDTRGAATAAPPPSGVSKPKAPPQGFTQATGGPVSLSHPRAWRPLGAQRPQGWALGVAQETATSVDIQLGVITKGLPKAPEPAPVAMASTTALQMNTHDFQNGPNRDVKIPGAKGAIRVDYTFTSAGGDEPGFPSRGTDVAVVSASGQVAVVRVLGLQSELSPALVERIVGTIAVVA